MNFQIYYFSLLGIFAVIAYMIIADPNVGKFIYLLYKLAQVNFNRFVFWIKFYPKLRYDTAILKWRSSRILKKQLKEKDYTTPGE